MKASPTVLSALLLILFATMGSAESYAQARLTLDPEKAVTQYRHTVWTSADGLPQNTVGALEQTRDGYLWLGTQEGLARFDGQRFTVFDRKTVDAFTVNSVQELAEAPDGTLWIGLRGGGVVAYADGRFTAYTSADGLSSDYVTALHADDDGTVWIGTFEGGVNRLRDGTFTAFGADQGLPGRVVSLLYRDPDGVLRAGTDAGLFTFDGGGFVPAPDAVPDGAYPTACFVDSRGHHWVGARDGRLWQIRDGTLIDHSAQVANPEGYVKTILEDAEGTLWFGVRGGGLLRYRAGRFSAFGQAQGLSHDAVLSLEEDREGGLWIGTTSGLDRLQDGKFTTYTTHEGLAHDKAMSVHEDAAGAIWIATDGGGVSRLRDGTFTTYTTADGLASDNVLTVNSDPSGAVWAGTLGSGLHRIRGDRIEHFTTEDGLAGNEIYVLYTDAQGRLWIGTEGGVSRYDGAAFVNVTTEEGLTSPFVSAILEGRDGSVWIGTYDGGLNRLKDGAVTTYTSRHGLFDDTVAAILEDDAGRLWMTCNKGIFRVDKRDLNAFAEGKLDGISSTVFGVADGLKTAEANGGQQPAAWKDRQGRLWFPMTEGVAMIDPAHLRTNEVVPPVVVEQVTVDRKPVDLTAEILLPPGSDKLEFQYVALSLAAPERVRYEVMLEGHDEAWIDAAGRREAFYTNLDPGSYTFRVRAANNDGVWNEAGAAVTFYLKPFFYQTAWFWGLCAFGLLLLAFTGYHVRIRRLKARERELERVVDERTRDLRLEKEKTEQAKEVIEEQADKLRELDRFKTRFFANVSHEFRTPLTMIIGPLENAIQGLYGPLAPTLRQQSDIMLRNALRLMRLINQLLDLSKLEANKMELKAQTRNVVPFLEGILYSFTPFAEKKEVRLQFHADADDLELFFEPDKFEKVFFNLLSNAAKFTPKGGEIAVAVAEQEATDTFPEGAVEIRVRDTGRGIPEKDLPYIFDRFHQVDGSNTRDHEGTGIGLALVKELILLHHGTVEAESEVGVGTEFIITVPRGKAHLSPDQLAAGDEATGALHYAHGALTEFASSGLDFLHADEHVIQTTSKTPVPDDAPLVLVIDDNKDVREYVGTILNAHYRVAHAADGVEGLEKARAMQPNLIISDVMMPRMDGNDLCRHIKTDPDLDHIPVILLTARATHEGRLSGLEVGADDYMAKPFNARELLVRVRNLVTLRQQEKELKTMNEHLEQKVQEQLDLILSEREKYESELIVARDRAESSSRLKSSILDNINHEFRTPLSTIQGYSQIIIEEAPDELQEFAAAIEEGSRRLMTTLNAVIDMADVEAMEVEAHAQPLDLADEARRTVDTFREKAEEKGLRLHVRPPLDQAVPVHLDQAALRRVLSALLDNAVKFTEAGEVVVEMKRQGETAVLTVRDTGIGIEEDALATIFDAFTQGSTGLTRNYEGCGLGLTIARRLTERMGGTLTATSTPGAGSLFTLRLPSAPAGAPALRRQVPTRDAPPA